MKTTITIQQCIKPDWPVASRLTCLISNCNSLIIAHNSNGWLSVQCLPVCHLVLGDSWSNVWPTWTSESGWLGGVLQFVDFQRKIMGWFELLLLIELEYNNIVISSILTLPHSLVFAGWSVSVYLANLICVCFPGQPNRQFHFMCVPFYMRLHYVTCLRSNWRITYGKISPERIIHCLSVINVLFSTFW